MGRGDNPSYAQRRADQRYDRMEQQDWRLHEQATNIRYAIPEKVRAEREKLDKQRESEMTRERNATATQVVELLSRPVVQRKGGVRGPITVTHWKTPLIQHIADDEPPSGPLFILTADGVQSVVNQTIASNPPELATPRGMSWRETALEAQQEFTKRYRFVGELVNNSVMEGIFKHVGLTRETTTDETVELDGIKAKRKRTTIDIPSLIGVEVTPEGLQLTYAHRTGDGPTVWSPKIPLLISAFNAMSRGESGFRADSLKITSDNVGNIILDFDDAPSGFPAAIAPEAPALPAPSSTKDAAQRYRNAAWVLGVDARGRDISFPCENFQHILVTGETGGGKSVWVRTQIEAMRAGDRNGSGGWSVFIVDGKGSDYVTMRDLPNIGFVASSSDIHQVVWVIGVVEQEMQRRIRVAAERKSKGDAQAYEFQPILLLIDEWGTTATRLRQEFKKDADKIFAKVDAILRLGREPRVHLALASQNIRKTGDAAVPGSWFVNFKLIVSLGNPDTETIQSAFPDSFRARAAELGPRIRGKRGRGMYANLDTNKVTEFQSYYGWSPGTTSLDPNASRSVAPPNDQVRRSWEAWEKVSSNVPALIPRYGIKADGPEWRESVDSIFSTPPIPLTDPSGKVRDGLECYDPYRVDWIGAEQVADSGPVVDLSGFDVSTDSSAPTTAQRTESVKTTETPSPAQRSSAQQSTEGTDRLPSLDEILADPSHPKRAEIIAHLRSQGIHVPGLTDQDDDNARNSTDELRDNSSTNAHEGETMSNTDAETARRLSEGPYAPKDDNTDNELPLIDAVKEKVGNDDEFAQRARALGLNINLNNDNDKGSS